MNGELFPSRVPQQQVGGLDAWYTPQRLALSVCARLERELGWRGRALEPHAGSGSWVRAWLCVSHLNTCAAWDINPDAPALHMRRDRDRLTEQVCRDFLDGETPRAVDYVIGNPPYSGEHEVGVPHVERALRMAAHGVAFLLPLYFLASGRRFRRLHSVQPPNHVWVVTPRPGFGGAGTGAHEVAICVWDTRPRGGVSRSPSMSWLDDSTGRRWR